jgi:hypothetical protein
MNSVIKLAAILCVLITLVGCASNSGVISMGNNTFMITHQAATGFSGSGSLKAEVVRDAAKYCEMQGKQMKVVSITEAKPPYILANYPKAEIVFKALPPNDPELKTEPSYDPSGTQIKVGEQPPIRASVDLNEKQVTSDDVYSKLEKLNELRKKGILTDEEFTAEKKKLLNEQQ